MLKRADRGGSATLRKQAKALLVMFPLIASVRLGGAVCPVICPLLIVGGIPVGSRGVMSYFHGRFSEAGVGGVGGVSGIRTRGGNVPGIPRSKTLLMAAGGKCCFSFFYRWANFIRC